MNPGYKAMNSDDSFSSAGRMLITSDGGRRFEGLLKSDTKKVSYYSGLIKQKLTDILGRSKNQIMMIEDLAKALVCDALSICKGVSKWEICLSPSLALFIGFDRYERGSKQVV